MNKNVLVAPSILSADFSRMDKAVNLAVQAGADLIHVDVMDGRFVPDITFGHKMVADIRKLTDLPLDVHLMVENPENQVVSFAKAGSDIITFHPEVVLHSHRLLAFIKSLGKKAGISMVPSTPVCMIKELLPFIDHMLVMTVNPGYGGQVLIPECLEKVAELCRLRAEKGYEFTIAVDGGINVSTIPRAREAGTDILIMGSAFFEAQDPQGLVAAARGIKTV